MLSLDLTVVVPGGSPFHDTSKIKFLISHFSVTCSSKYSQNDKYDLNWHI